MLFQSFICFGRDGKANERRGTRLFSFEQRTELSSKDGIDVLKNLTCETKTIDWKI